MRGGYNAVFNNASGATFEFAGTGSYVGNYYQNGGTTFNNAGTVVKRNEGTARLEGTLNNLGAAIDVEGGTLNLSGGGSSSGGQFEVAAESLLQFTAGTSTYTLTGTYAGSGAGQVRINQAVVAAEGNATLNFPMAALSWFRAASQGRGRSRSRASSWSAAAAARRSGALPSTIRDCSS